MKRIPLAGSTIIPFSLHTLFLFLSPALCLSLSLFRPARSIDLAHLLLILLVLLVGEHLQHLLLLIEGGRRRRTVQ